ncbi:hypothetical protein ACIL2N_002367 [Vibrio metschnikovii]|uniref:hypothetical protein n=1 Tax=Vibrio metschnikovii TaxID=28172 RepID=UPI00165E509E|nr:hypothetical protein [Vibrio metschnikovii]
MIGGGLSNSGTMPINGGDSGPAVSGGDNSNTFTVGSLNMGGSSSGGGMKDVLIYAVIGLALYVFVKSK